MRETKDDANLRKILAKPLSLAFRVRHRRQNERGRKIYSLHAPEIECIGKGKTHRPYEFGVNFGRDHAQPLEGRAVHRPRQDAAGKPL